MDGRALTAAELAGVAGITPQTASTHLARLIGAELVTVEKQGRNRYHRLAGPAVAWLMQHTTGGIARQRVPRTGPRDESMRRARTCYDHLAGRLGVDIADVLVAQGDV
jgi:DNA-binding transcriptional ArsR family regulator